MTTSTDHSTDTFETVQHYDEPTRLTEALTEHMVAAMEQGVRGERIYHVRSNGAATDWVISCEPVTQARQPAILFEPKDDFPCCGPTGTGHGNSIGRPINAATQRVIDGRLAADDGAQQRYEGIDD